MAGRSIPDELSTLKVLADPLSRELIQALRIAGGPRSTSELAHKDLHGHYVTRTVRERLTRLERSRLVQRNVPPPVSTSGPDDAAVDGVELSPSRRRRRPAVGQAYDWALTDAGEALCRIGELMAMVAVNLCPPAQRATTHHGRLRVLERVLKDLADDLTRETLRVLTYRPPGTGEIVRACHERFEASERNVSRRLALLAKRGVLICERTHERDSRMKYQLLPGWHPLATIMLLAAYWEFRHDHAALGDPVLSSDLRAYLGAVAPTARMPAGFDGAVQRWSVEDPDYPSDTLLVVRGRKLRILDQPTRTTTADASFSGRPRRWTEALLHHDYRHLKSHGRSDLLRATASALYVNAFAGVDRNAIRTRLDPITPTERG